MQGGFLGVDASVPDGSPRELRKWIVNTGAVALIEKSVVGEIFSLFCSCGNMAYFFLW